MVCKVSHVMLQRLIIALIRFFLYLFFELLLLLKQNLYALPRDVASWIFILYQPRIFYHSETSNKIFEPSPGFVRSKSVRARPVTLLEPTVEVEESELEKQVSMSHTPTHLHTYPPPPPPPPPPTHTRTHTLTYTYLCINTHICIYLFVQFSNFIF